MARIAFAADVHVANIPLFEADTVAGLNRRCRQVLDALRWAHARAVEEGCDAFVVLGDLFDTARPTPQVVRAVQAIFDDSIPVVLLVGNHDLVSTQPGDHALGPLEPVATVVERPTRLEVAGVDLWMVPFRPGDAEDWLVEATGELNADGHDIDPSRTVLCLHAGIADDTTPSFLAGSKDAVTVDALVEQMVLRGAHKAFAGNWHEHKAWPRLGITQVGALAPTGFDNPGLHGYGWMAVFDSERDSVDAIPVPGPRFLDIAGLSGWAEAERLIRARGPRTRGCVFYARWRAPAAELAEARRVLDEAIQEGLILAGSAETDQAEQRERAEAAAAAARAASTLEEALAAFVEEMPLPKEVDRALVLASSKTFLGI